MAFFSSVRGNLGATGRGGVRKNPPEWVTPAGSLGITYDNQRATKSYTVSATPPVGETVTYSLTSGSLPTGMSLTSANGFIGGTASSVGSNTTSTFDITATSTSNGTEVRSFSILVRPQVVETFAYTGSNQTWNKPEGLTQVTAKVWGAAGGAGPSYNQNYGGAGGYSSGTINVAPASSLVVVVGQGGAVNYPFGTSPGTFGHPAPTPVGRPGGDATAAGNGGGLSGLFNGSVSHPNSILISAGGGGAGAVQPTNVPDAVFSGNGGAGGGAQQAGNSGSPAPVGGHGRGAPVAAGGQTGAAFYISPNAATGVTNTPGGALYGGTGHSGSNWTEGGGGGSGYYGGGSGSHDVQGGYWSPAGGGAGYASPLVSNITAERAPTGTGATLPAPASSSEPNYAPGIANPNAGGAGGNGRVVIIY